MTKKILLIDFNVIKTIVVSRPKENLIQEERALTKKCV